MKFVRHIIIVALVLAYFLPLGGWEFLSHYRGLLLDPHEVQLATPIPISPAAFSSSSGSISIGRDSPALGAVSLYSLLLSSIAAEQNQPASHAAR